MAQIKIKSWPKNEKLSSDNLETKQWDISDLGTSRKLIIEQREFHQKNSEWFGIFIEEKMVFDSNYIHHGKYKPEANQLTLF
jgi:hypothetical protein